MPVASMISPPFRTHSHTRHHNRHTQVAALSPGSSTAAGDLADVTGGDPARLSGDVYLCSRQDSDEDRWGSVPPGSLLCC